MSQNKITQKTNYSFIQTVATMQQYQHESDGNSSDINTYVDITLDGSGNVGQVIFGSGQQGDILFRSVVMKTRPGGGIDFWNGQGIKIASLDTQGNFKCKGSITGNTTP